MRHAAQQSSGRRTLVVITVLALFMTCYVLGIVLYNAAQEKTKVHLGSKTPSGDQLETVVTTNSIDPVKGDLVLRVQMTPAGGLVAPDGITLARPIKIDVDSTTGKANYSLAAGERINPFEVTVAIDGSSSAYPFDSYAADFLLIATEAGPTTTRPDAAAAVASRAAPPAAAMRSIPLNLDFLGAINGYRIDAATQPALDGDLVSVGIAIKRDVIVQLAALLILLIMVLLAGSAFALALSIALLRRVPELPMLTWLAALLFALTPLRTVMPAAPPIGIVIDVTVYFWAVAIVALSLLTVLIKWLRHTRQTA